MTSFDEIGAMLDSIAEELPGDFFKELNGGINLLPDTVVHPESRKPGDLFIMGDYHNERLLGRYINIYYGSFMKLYAHIPPHLQREKLKSILVHEFTHHLESLAGERGLEIKDIQDLERYRRRK